MPTVGALLRRYEVIYSSFSPTSRQRRGSHHIHRASTPTPDTYIVTMRQNWIPGESWGYVWGLGCVYGGLGSENRIEQYGCPKP